MHQQGLWYVDLESTHVPLIVYITTFPETPKQNINLEVKFCLKGVNLKTCFTAFLHRTWGSFQIIYISMVKEIWCFSVSTSRTSFMLNLKLSFSGLKRKLLNDPQWLWLCTCDFAPFGLLIALIKVELFIWDIVDIFSKSWNHIEHQKNEQSLLLHFTFFSCFLSVWITLCNSATVGCYECGLISNTLTLPLVNE